MPEATGTQGSIEHAVTMLRAAADAPKCWACGCLRHALDTIDHARPPPGRHDVSGCSARFCTRASPAAAV